MAGVDWIHEMYISDSHIAEIAMGLSGQADRTILKDDAGCVGITLYCP
jgi:hypothetical protein